MNLNKYLLVTLCGLVLASCSITPSSNNSSSINPNSTNADSNNSEGDDFGLYQASELRMLADAYQQALLKSSQPFSYLNDLKVQNHNKFLNNSPQALLRMQKIEDEILVSLLNINAEQLKNSQQKVFHAKFVEALESSVQERVCRSELWNINHMSGAHHILGFIVNLQPVETQRERMNALARWRAVGGYYMQEIENLRSGLKKGYSAPKAVVKRVVSQLSSLIAINIDEHPYMALAKRVEDQAFEAFALKFKTLLSQELLPTIKHYRDYLQNEYLPQARNELGIHVLPEGRACYIAKYRSNTTLKRTPEQVYELGLKTVNANKTSVVSLGKTIYGVNTFKQTIDKANADDTQKFSDADAMHDFFVDVVTRAKKVMPKYFSKMPTIEMEVAAFPQYQQGLGQSAHYVLGSDKRIAKFEYDPTTFNNENYGTAEIVSLHEGYPGHHMQIALVQNQQSFHPIEAMFSNSAYAEGWARYAEALSEEAGLYKSKSAKILRRAWPARGMVADVALHVLGWSNEKVAQFMIESGASFINDIDSMLDRMAAMPAQLTSYDSGALEIFALREQMEKQQGDDFDIKEFHRLILKNGNVPLSLLREQVLNSD